MSADRWDVPILVAATGAIPVCGQPPWGAPNDRGGTNRESGDDVVIATDVTLNVDARVTIGDGASLGPFVRVYTATHRIGPGSRRMLPQVAARPVTIGRGAWIGLGATVLPGVTIGDGAVVAAGSVVTSDVSSNSYVEGNPAVAVRTLPWGDR